MAEKKQDPKTVEPVEVEELNPVAEVAEVAEEVVPTHETHQEKIVAAEKALQAAKDEYKAFCKDNPYELPKQPTVHELIQARRKLSPDKPEDHAKANAAAASAAQKAALKQELKSEG